MAEDKGEKIEEKIEGETPYHYQLNGMYPYPSILTDLPYPLVFHDRKKPLGRQQRQRK